MNESLKEWRRYYCDSSVGSQQCARFILSGRGEVVPLGLLPNGRHAQHIQLYAGEAASPAVSGSAASAASDVTAAPATATRVLPDAPDVADLFQPMRAPEPLTAPRRPAPSSIPRPRPSIETAPARNRRTTRRPTRRPIRAWWARFTNWMKGHDE